ncbi:PIG-L family deacetylase [Nocardioides guangzhouensis]|uniref:PIG-L family deacetylase n=1 Tax=Nocardioides guangzhouensis TaxID=2497878 RepID=A0A4Q4Z7Z7_9ACTN|nr:PIG-L family deacetylase [Nocardioides guangzhouensis]RYP83903.1 PIG-L family deacetylase [Nocardioides guangzhouensis]
MTDLITGPREHVPEGLHARVLDPRPTAVPLRAWQDRLARMESRPDPLAGADRVLVVSAHPDDETIGAGRLVAGFPGPAVAVTMTAGERCLAGEGVDAVDIGVRRVAEWRSAVSALGAEALETQRWPDGQLDRHQAEVARLLVRLAQPGDVLLVPWRHDPDRDHRALGAAAVEAAAVAGVRVVEYPVWAPYLRTPHEVGATGQALVPVDTDAEAGARWRRALGEYLSQVEPWLPGWAPLVPADLLQHHVTQLIVEGEQLHP